MNEPNGKAEFLFKQFMYVIVIIVIFLIVITFNFESEKEIVSSNSSGYTGPGVEGIIHNQKSLFIIVDPTFDNTDLNLPIEELVGKYQGTGRIWIEEEEFKEELQSGQKVRIWFNEVLESYPPIYRVEKIKVLENV